MKILFLTPSYFPAIGGVEKHIENICEVLKKNHEITILSESRIQGLPESELHNGIHIKRIDTHTASESEKKWLLWKWVWKNRAWIRQFDVVHIHDIFFWVLPLLLFPHPKMYITFHGYEGSSAPSIRQRAWHLLAAALTKGNICIGGFHQKWYGVQPNRVSFGAVDSKKSQSNSVRKKNIVYIGRLHEDTGILTYIRSLAGTQYQIDVFGDGPDRQAAEQLASSLKVKAYFHGFVSNAADRIGEYKVAYISRYLGILEAFSHKTPVIAHYNNDIKFDYLSLTPFHQWIAILSTPSDIQKRLRSILNGERNTKSSVESAYTWATLQTWEQMAKEYEAVWQRK